MSEDENADEDTRFMDRGTVAGGYGDVVRWWTKEGLGSLADPSAGCDSNPSDDGIVPFRTLGLSQNIAEDGYGHYVAGSSNQVNGNGGTSNEDDNADDDDTYIDSPRILTGGEAGYDDIARWQTRGNLVMAAGGTCPEPQSPTAVSTPQDCSLR